MKFTLPLLVQEMHFETRSPQFAVRPMFFAGPKGLGEHLSRATSNMAQAVRKDLDRLGKSLRCDALLPWTFNPELREHRLTARLNLRRGTADCSTLVVSFPALDRRLAMLPAIPNRWFEVLRGQDVEQRAAEVLTEYLNQLQKEIPKFVVPATLTSKNRQWLSSIDLDIQPEPEFKSQAESVMAMLGAAPKMFGRLELQKVGRCLDWQYPDDLDRAVQRESEVEELERLLSSTDRRPVLLLGLPSAGKTAVLHECVFHRVQKPASPHVGKRNVWLLSPPRLISGMMYVGQWESRVTSILTEAAKRDHVLYFDDVLGLYSAGRSRDSDLTVADLLKPAVERREFRMLAEMTPEAFRILQEKDRGLADQFHILPIRPTSEDQTRRILFDLRRQLEARHRCRFNLDVLPLAMDLSNRYLRELAQPGKSAQLFRQLAIKFSQREIARQETLADFRDRSGLSLAFLDDRARLKRAEVIEAIRKTVSGQDEAVTAMADAVCIAKARLNDPGRALATFLFLGPTGVGKTECAKALCAYLFGDANRLLRFDMNEYLDAASPARLIGTFSEPEGLLTSAIRRQPFSVVLLDEIEKAHPAVFDLLLQVLGEGRLTDSLGRTADFTNSIIIMTSNLGARSAKVNFGLRSAPDSQRQAYITAAEQFFRPEFFNRIDRLVPFEPLDRAQVARIADRLIHQVLRRDGLVHRQCVLWVDPLALEQIIDQGFHPDLGARALKRTLERQLTQPVAFQLAQAATDAPTVIRVLAGSDGIKVHAAPLMFAQRRGLLPAGLDPDDWEQVLDSVDGVVDRVQVEIAGIQPAGQLTQGTLSASNFRYLAVTELIRTVLQAAETIEHVATTPKRREIVSRSTVHAPRPGRKMLMINDGDMRLCLRAAADLDSHLASIEIEPPVFGDSLHDQLIELISSTAMMAAIASSDDADSRCLLWLRSPNQTAEVELTAMIKALGTMFGENLGMTATEIPVPAQQSQRERAMLLEMPGIARLLAVEQGTHLFSGWGRGMVVVQAIVRPAGEADAAKLLDRMRQEGESADAFPLLPVLRVYDGNGMTMDLRSGLGVKGLPSAEQTREFLVSQLPIPAEFQGDP